MARSNIKNLYLKIACVPPYLVFMKIDSSLNEEEYYFEGSKIREMNYVVDRIEHGCSNTLQFGKLNMYPIKEAFLLHKKELEDKKV